MIFFLQGNEISLRFMKFPILLRAFSRKHYMYFRYNTNQWMTYLVLVVGQEALKALCQAGPQVRILQPDGLPHVHCVQRGCLIITFVRLSFKKIARFGSRKAKISHYQNHLSKKTSWNEELEVLS